MTKSSFIKYVNDKKQLNESVDDIKNAWNKDLSGLRIDLKLYFDKNESSNIKAKLLPKEFIKASEFDPNKSIDPISSWTASVYHLKKGFANTSRALKAAFKKSKYAHKGKHQISVENWSKMFKDIKKNFSDVDTSETYGIGDIRIAVSINDINNIEDIEKFYKILM